MTTTDTNLLPDTHLSDGCPGLLSKIDRVLMARC
jgi:hypothetical protein